MIWVAKMWVVRVCGLITDMLTELSPQLNRDFFTYWPSTPASDVINNFSSLYSKSSQEQSLLFFEFSYCFLTHQRLPCIMTFRCVIFFFPPSSLGLLKVKLSFVSLQHPGQCLAHSRYRGLQETNEQTTAKPEPML